MKTDKPYQRSHAEALLKPVDDGQSWVIDDLGVWPAADFKEFEALGGRPEYNVLSWKPVMVFKDDRSAPDCKNTPALPFPFDAGDLAAFMLAGTGSFVADYYGSWEHSPDEDALDEIDPGDNYARQAVCDAYDAYHAAIQKVGEVAHKLQRRANVLDKCYRRKRRRAIEKAGLKDLPHVSLDGGETYRRAREQALEPLAGKKAALELARADAEGAHQRWLRAMVEELLLKAEPGMAHAFGAPKEATPAVAPEPVVNSASNMPLPLTTGDIAFCFDGIRWSEQKWRKPLGDKPKWLQSCVAIPGQRGVSETRWNPVLIAAALVHDGYVQARSIRARFQTKPQLKDWREAWETYEADNFNTQ